MLLEDPLILELAIQISELDTRELRNISIPLVRNSAQASKLHDALVRLSVNKVTPVKKVRFDLSQSTKQ